MYPPSVDSRLSLELLIESFIDPKKSPQQISQDLVRALDNREVTKLLLRFLDARHNVLEYLPHLDDRKISSPYGELES
jgi:hypothetical protein